MLTRKDNHIEPLAYRDAMARFAGAVHILTTDGPAGRRGVTVSATCSVSDDPATVLVCLNRNQPLNDIFIENGVFAINTLAGHHEPLALAFSGLSGLDQDERFAGGEWQLLETGAPVLADALAVFDCRLIEARDVATHRILLGKVTGLRIGDNNSALIYHNRGYHTLES